MHFDATQNPQSSKIELGQEPPLLGYEGVYGMSDRRGVSLRWFAGSALTGVTSLFLMGGALFAAFDGQYEVERAKSSSAFLNELSISNNGYSKEDRVLRSAAEHSSKQLIDVNIVSREGDRDSIRAQPHIFISATLATKKDPSLASKIPAFSTLNIFSSSAEKEATGATEGVATSLLADSLYGAKLANDVSISLTPFPSSNTDFDLDKTLSESEIELKVRKFARTRSVDATNMGYEAVIDPGRFDFNLALQPDLERYAVRITPENVSFVSKRDDDIRLAGIDESIVPVTRGQNLTRTLLNQQVPEVEAASIALAFQRLYGISKLEDGQRLRIAYAPSQDDLVRKRPVRISLYSDTKHEATVALSDGGDYIKARPPSTFPAAAFADADRVSHSGPTPALYDSLYQTALEQNIPKNVVNELVRMLSFSIDFKASIRPGATIELLYSRDDRNFGSKIHFAALSNGKTTLEYYRFRTPDDGATDFYDAFGQSAKKFLLRKPIDGGKFRSGFGMRRHPVYKYSRMHKGVDWSAPRGTPIMAAGDGTVIKAGWSSGYGKRIELRHTNGYTTTYNHQTGFAKGIKEGVRVKQGQIIGYVGSTGLSTGPHLHFEMLANGQPLDPMRARLPEGRVLDREMRDRFESERSAIDNLLRDARRPRILQHDYNEEAFNQAI
ncbi:M23 family metallopeptidase [Labrenzia sp. R4_2]|uniref:M23 family metallopeptidase n=1 Tax=Labrenzia sp. R4_2 TaxID=2821107 RepID=UPI001ADAB60B|nr:M23 family metallopeptidase [Labrenzia sp. R4_2]MBO9422819.1 M23 family metallopeptidase [Labrenzia sp. R4_2]